MESSHIHLYIFVQLGISYNVTSDTVTLTNFDSLVAKSLSDLHYNSSTNFQSNAWQKVQYNTDLLKQKQGYLYRNGNVN